MPVPASPASTTPANSGEQIPGQRLAQKPSHLLSNLLSYAAKFCDAEVPQLFPHPDFSALPSADLGTFIVSDVSADGEAIMRQARELSARLEIDARFVGKTPGTLTPHELNQLLKAATFNLVNVKARSDVATSLLGALTEAAALTFKSFLMTKPTDLLTTEIHPSCLAVLAAADVKVDPFSNPGKVYQAISIRFNAVERLAMELAMERIKLQLQFHRLQMIKVTGDFLAAQAQRLLDTEFLGNDDFQPGEHHTEIQLTACANNPFVEVWPNPRLNRDERHSEALRLAPVMYLPPEQ